MTASTPLGPLYPPCLHPMPRKEKLGWLVIWIVVAAAVLAINIAHPEGRQPLPPSAIPLNAF